jgi:hypothetical protein
MACICVLVFIKQVDYRENLNWNVPMEIPEELIEAKDEVQFELLEIPGVTGVGIGFREEGEEILEEELAVRIYVADETKCPQGCRRKLAACRSV